MLCYVGWYQFKARTDQVHNCVQGSPCASTSVTVTCVP
jgi:hypothetical protein